MPSCEGDAALQTRLPGVLAAQLQSIVADYESDMALLRAENSDSETLSLDMPDTVQCPLVFPSGQLLEVLSDAVKVNINCPNPCWKIATGLPSLFTSSGAEPKRSDSSYQRENAPAACGEFHGTTLAGPAKVHNG